MIKFFTIIAGLTMFIAGQCTATEVIADPLQRLIQDGPYTAASVVEEFSAQLTKQPNNPRLLYNHALAAYAAGRFDEALLSFDQVENQGRRALSQKARFQKGNTEFKMGEAALHGNLDETISHWKQSLDYYQQVLKENSADAVTRTNYLVVQRLLTDLLVQAAKVSEKSAEPTNQPPDKQIQDLRSAHEKFSDAAQTDPNREEAKAGEERTRDKLAESLAKEGTKRASRPPGMKANPREPSLPMLNLEPIQEGVGMLEDAKQLKPGSQEIQKSLTQAKQKLADALNQQAQIYLMLEERIAVPKEKLAILRMGKEIANRALDQVPEHQGAQETLKEIDRRLAKIHEEQGDTFSQLSEQQNLENQAMMLSQSLDNYQQAGELKPQEKRLEQKAKKTQEKLEQALDKLGDKLMQPQPGESMEQQIARLEGAQQALSELMGMKPSEKTGKRAEQVGKDLEGLRQGMAQKGKPMPGSGQMPMMAQSEQMQQQGMPRDAPPKINTQGQKGPWSSPTMLRSLKDY